MTPAKLADVVTPTLDCGDNSCRFAEKRWGMRTNGGCRCLSDLDRDPEKRMAVVRRLIGLRDDRDRLAAELEALRSALSAEQVAHGQCLIEHQEVKRKNARLVALLEYEGGDFVASAFACDAAIDGGTGECVEVTSAGEQCFEHRRRALLAEIKAGG